MTWNRRQTSFFISLSFSIHHCNTSTDCRSSSNTSITVQCERTPYGKLVNLGNKKRKKSEDKDFFIAYFNILEKASIPVQSSKSWLQGFVVLVLGQSSLQGLSRKVTALMMWWSSPWTHSSSLKRFALNTSKDTRQYCSQLGPALGQGWWRGDEVGIACDGQEPSQDPWRTCLITCSHEADGRGK